MATQSDPQLTTYRDKRDPTRTPEPFGRIHIPPTGQLFVVQQHHASHLHFDLRLEVGGVLKSWAVPKGPSDDPGDKRFAVETEDHPLDYADFEGEIPAGNYGAGQVIVWDRGRYRMLEDFSAGFKRGKLLFELFGYKLKGIWTLVRLKSKDSTGREWLLIKERDSYASDQGVTFSDESVLSGQLVSEHKAGGSGTQKRLRRQLKSVSAARVKTFKRVNTRPMLAAAASDAHNRKGWLWELKYDGYRIVASKTAGEIKLLTRNGYDLADRFPEICQVLSHLPYDDLIMDGELVINDAGGRPNFHLMQTRARTRSSQLIGRAAIEQPATYYAFDLLYVAGTDLRDATLPERKKLLELVVPRYGAIVFSAHVADQGVATYEAAREMGIEGVVGKRAASRYQHGRSQDWVKVRNSRSTEFIVIGWSGDNTELASLSSLALAEYRGDKLAYVGHVGSGLSQHLRQEFERRLRSLTRKTCPIKPAPTTRKTTRWVTPRIVVEVAYTEYTPFGHLRHPSLLRIRDDKTPAECQSLFDAVDDTQVSVVPADVKVTVTNPDKIFFPEPGFTKADLVRYYRGIAPWMLPDLERRPLVLTRYPDGVTGKSFYQRDIPDYVPDWIQRETLWSSSTDSEVQYFIARSAEDLAYLANMGTIPIHLWHSTTEDLEHPDWCVIDLDPKLAPFDDVITLALAIGELADQIGLPAYPKTSGASGLHVLLPLGRQLTHDQSQTLGELLARVLVERYPEIATITRTVRARGKKVYVDYLQNGHGRLIAAPYAARAEAAGSVSMPLRWHEVNRGLRPARYHIGNAVRRMQRLGTDPLRDVLQKSPDLLRALEQLAALLA
ncbi:MAG: DNA ligase D [Pseudomonadales bacterium]